MFFTKFNLKLNENLDSFLNNRKSLGKIIGKNSNFLIQDLNMKSGYTKIYLNWSINYFFNLEKIEDYKKLLIWNICRLILILSLS